MAHSLDITTHFRHPHQELSVSTGTLHVVVALGASLLLIVPAAAIAQTAVAGNSPIEGAIDFHVHTGPDAFGRSISDFDVAELAARRGVRAIVLKNHVTMTSDRAALVAQAVPGIEVFGGVALNRSVGGLNAEAVEAMVLMAGGRGKVVWLPTIDAQHYADRFGAGGKTILRGQGIRVAQDGQVVPQLMPVLERIRAHDLVLHTGHVSPQETLAVIRAAREMGIGKIVVTHAMASVPGMSLDQMRQAASLGAYIELAFLNHLMGPEAYLEWMNQWDRVTIADMAAAVREIGAQHFILSSDLGAAGLPVHPDGYQSLVVGLEQAGIPRTDIEMMMRDNPARLLGLETGGAR